MELVNNNSIQFRFINIIIIIIIVENISVYCVRLSTVLIGNTPINDYKLYIHMLTRQRILHNIARAENTLNSTDIINGVISDEFHKCC
jgi:hypothetical protein